MTNRPTGPVADAEAEADPIRSLERLQEIADLGLVSPAVDPVLQEAVAAAAARFGLAVGLVSVILDNAQYFAAHHGLSGWISEVRGTPVEWSFCANTVRTRRPFVVEDAAEHPLVKDNPVVRLEGIRCYAGIPLITSRGHVLGTLCVAGTETRRFSDEEMDDLRALAAQAVARIEARRHAPADESERAA
jgi:GAF domain-containing protein